jgi:hypothetical protein
MEFASGAAMALASGTAITDIGCGHRHWERPQHRHWAWPQHQHQNKIGAECCLVAWWLWPMPMPPKRIPDAKGCTVTMSDKLSKYLVCAIINLL